MYGIGVGADLRDAANNLVEVGQSGLGLGVRDYYVNDDEQTKKIRDAYKAYMKKLFQMVGNDEATAQKKMEAVIQFSDFCLNFFDFGKKYRTAYSRHILFP